MRARRRACHFNHQSEERPRDVSPRSVGFTCCSIQIPVVKLHECIFNTSVDISFAPVDPCPSVALVHDWALAMPQLRSLVLLLKALLVQWGLNDVYSGGLGSFAAIVMVRHFLCTLDHAPEAPRSNKENNERKHKKRLHSGSPLGPLLLQCLRYLAQFPYASLAIRHDGSCVDKAPADLGAVLVVLNPLADAYVNMAASSYRFADVVAMFRTVERQLRAAVNAADGAHLSGGVFVADPGVDAYRRFLAQALSSRANGSVRVGKRVEKDEATAREQDAPLAPPLTPSKKLKM